MVAAAAIQAACSAVRTTVDRMSCWRHRPGCLSTFSLAFFAMTSLSRRLSQGLAAATISLAALPLAAQAMPHQRGSLTGWPDSPASERSRCGAGGCGPTRSANPCGPAHTGCGPRR
jgi:hypothetical protein